MIEVLQMLLQPKCVSNIQRSTFHNIALRFVREFLAAAARLLSSSNTVSSLSINELNIMQLIKTDEFKRNSLRFAEL